MSIISPRSKILMWLGILVILAIAIPGTLYIHGAETYLERAVRFFACSAIGTAAGMITWAILGSLEKGFLRGLGAAYDSTSRSISEWLLRRTKDKRRIMIFSRTTY